MAPVYNLGEGDVWKRFYFLLLKNEWKYPLQLHIYKYPSLENGKSIKPDLACSFSYESNAYFISCVGQVRAKLNCQNVNNERKWSMLHTWFDMIYSSNNGYTLNVILIYTRVHLNLLLIQRINDAISIIIEKKLACKCGQTHD